VPFTNIEYKGKHLTVHKAVTEPDFGGKTVLVTDTWDYVDLWLRRSGKDTARFYWQQARSFYEATCELPKTASPLTAYYCFLNATKALLSAKGVHAGDQHGVSGHTSTGRTSLAKEHVKFKPGGVLGSLCIHLGEPVPAGGQTYSLDDLLYNLPFVHRAYDLTFESAKELFLPIAEPRIVKSTTTHEAWFVAEFVGKYANKATLAKLPASFEQELGAGNDKQILVRSKQRFDWRPREKAASLGRYKNFHRALRGHLFYIAGPQRLWYLKRGGNIHGVVSRSSMTMTFAAMHKLSELARYTPERLARHFECHHNWLLSEFIASAPAQFIDEISSEMTGQEFMTPGRASRR
jgi:hypothetical protein